MALAAAAVRVSPSRGWIAVQDDSSGGTVPVSNAALCAAFPAGTPLGDLVRTPVLNDQAAQDALWGTVGEPSNHKTGRIFMGSQITGALAVPPQVLPRESLGLIVLSVISTAATASWIFYIEQIHSAIR